MGRRRGEFDILFDVLSAALKDARATHIMYKANLSYSTLRKYLSTALDNGLIIRVCDNNGSVFYRTTEKGRVLLRKLRDVNSSLLS